jgi:predicted N-acetyltransferase YhbS
MSEANVLEALSLRAATPDDAEACQRLSKAVSWPHRAEDWQLAIQLGQGVVAILDGAIVATALSWPYGDSHATLGMIIVEPGHQGAGIGKRLMQALFAEVAGRSLILNATVAGRPLYEKTGFEPCGGVHQHQGVVPATPAPVLAPTERLRAGSPADLALLTSLDMGASGLPRDKMLAALLECGKCVVLERAGVAVGFSILRRFGRGFVIGPIVATDIAAARLLTAHWLHEKQGEFVRIDLLADAGLDDWLVEYGLPLYGVVVTMVRGDKPVPTGPSKLYAVVNQALG